MILLLSLLYLYCFLIVLKIFILWKNFSLEYLILKYPLFHQDVSCGAICLSPGKYDASGKLRKQTNNVSQSSNVKTIQSKQMEEELSQIFRNPEPGFSKTSHLSSTDSYSVSTGNCTATFCDVAVLIDCCLLQNTR